MLMNERFDPVDDMFLIFLRAKSVSCLGDISLKT